MRTGRSGPRYETAMKVQLEVGGHVARTLFWDRNAIILC